MQDKKEFLRQFISNYVQGANVDALLGTLSDEAQRQEDLEIAVTDQLSIITSSGEYTDKILAQIGITRPPELGMEDLAYKKMGIQINAQKQITEVLHTVLETFFGDETVRAWTQSTVAEPYQLADGDDLIFELESGETLTVPFSNSDFRNIAAATAQEVADVFSRWTRSQGINAYATAVLDAITNSYYVRLYGSAKGPYSTIKILGGRIQNKLEFPVIKGTELAVNTTVWEITRTVGSTIRFRWYSGPQPLLSNVILGDKVMIYGDAFVNEGFGGTFTVTNIRPPQPSPSYDSGWFEVENNDVQGLRSSQPDVAPLPNTVNDTYSYILSQTSYDDMKFFLPKKNVPYNQQRYALAFEPKNDLLKIYVPATTKVVRRDLIGSAHLHPLYDEFNLDGTFGHATDKSKQIEIINKKSFRYPQMGYDNIGYNGVATIGSTTVDIDYVARANGYTIVNCVQDHGLVGDNEWKNSIDYVVGDIVFYENASWTAMQNNGPSTTGAMAPNFSNVTIWSYSGSGRNMSAALASIDVFDVPHETEDTKFLGPYMIDPAAPYTLTDKIVYTRERIMAGDKIKTIYINGTMDTKGGLLLFGLNTDKQEGPVKYFSAQIANAPTTVGIVNLSQNGNNVIVTCAAAHGAIPGSQVQLAGISSPGNLNGTFTVDTVPSATSYTFTHPTSQIASVVGQGTSATLVQGTAATLLIDPSYTFKYTHEIGEDITLLSDRKAYEPALDGTDYGFYLTGTTEGRIFCQDLITQITALGIKLQIVVLYPSGIGLGHGLEPIDGPKFNDVLHIWG